MQNTLLAPRTLISTLLLTAVGGAVFAAPGGPTPAPKPTYAFEKCYGVANANKNDCGSRGHNSCAGTASVAKDPDAWIYVPAGTCAKIVGGVVKAG